MKGSMKTIILILHACIHVILFISSQIRELLDDGPEKHAGLLETIKHFRDEELEHLDTGIEHDAKQVSVGVAGL